MNNHEAQIVWAAGSFYTGGIDGVIGTMSRDAMVGVFAAFDVDRKWDVNSSRALVASVQFVLNDLGYQAGEVDGYDGHNTQNALSALLYYLANGEREVIEKTPLQTQVVVGDDIPSQSEVGKFYGDPETEVPGRIVQIELPFYMCLDWDMGVSTRRVSVHRLAAPSLEVALIEVWEHYGANRWVDLGLNRYAGCYNKRRMRGGDSWSMHAYGCAIDFHAQPNGLRTRCPEALFCNKDYKPFLDIMEKNGWFPAIRLWGADAMHFQRATL